MKKYVETVAVRHPDVWKAMRNSKLWGISYPGHCMGNKKMGRHWV